MHIPHKGDPSRSDIKCRLISRSPHAAQRGPSIGRIASRQVWHTGIGEIRVSGVWQNLQ
jgi:hypothetical protein